MPYILRDISPQKSKQFVIFINVDIFWSIVIIKIHISKIKVYRLLNFNVFNFGQVDVHYLSDAYFHNPFIQIK